MSSFIGMHGFDHLDGVKTLKFVKQKITMGYLQIDQMERKY
jgi:hypothetical protein